MRTTMHLKLRDLGTMSTLEHSSFTTFVRYHLSYTYISRTAKSDITGRAVWRILAACRHPIPVAVRSVAQVRTSAQGQSHLARTLSPVPCPHSRHSYYFCLETSPAKYCTYAGLPDHLYVPRMLADASIFLHEKEKTCSYNTMNVISRSLPSTNN
jgi:hypothetical protein